MKNLKLKGTILKKSLSLFIILSCIMFISNQAKSAPTFTLSSFLTGAGTSESPYLIYRPTQMDSLSTFVNAGGATGGKYFQMQNDLDFENNSFIPIGTSEQKFKGSFDGNGYSIKNIKIGTSTSKYVGIFGYVNIPDWPEDHNQTVPTIKNLGVINATVLGSQYVGAIIGYAMALNVMENCYVAHSSIGQANATYVGALVGYYNASVAGTVLNCYSNNNSVTGSDRVGGLFGSMLGANLTLQNCYNLTPITQDPAGNNELISPLIGEKSASQTVTYTNCYYMDNWSTNGYTNDAVGTKVVHDNTTDVATMKTNLKSGTNSTYIDDQFNLNNGYPILRTSVEGRPIDITSDVVINTTPNPAPSEVVEITDTTSFVDNTGTITNIKIKHLLKVGAWNLFGSVIAGKTAGVLNTNTGIKDKVGNSNVHDMVATKYNYTNNSWCTDNSGDYAYLYTTSPLNLGEGYFIWPLETNHVTSGTATTYTDDHVKVVESGTINTITSTFTKTCTGSEYGTANSYGAGNGKGYWYALSNPYAGRLEGSQFFKENTGKDIQGNLFYVYDAETGSWKNPTNNIVRPGQGFMVAKSASSELSLTFSKTQQVGATGRGKSAIQTKSLSDMITFTSKANNTEKDVYANISKVADNSFDINDAYVLLSTNNEDLVEPYFVVDNKMILKNEFKTLPYLAPINFHASKTSNVELVANNIPNDIKVSIINLNDNSETELNNKSVFNFVANSGENEGRFVMKFAQNDVSINDEAQSNEIAMSLYPNPASDQTTLTISGINGNAKVLLTDILGQTINSYNIVKGQNSLTIKTNDLTSGIYYVRIINNSISKTEKLIVK